MTLAGICRANAKDVRSDVWDCVETYVIYTTPCAQAKDHFISQS
jgi:hypothetical protein